jgi:ribonuclease HI
MKEESIVIHTDGGARGNPGPAACAFVAEDRGKVLKKASKYLGSATNNIAEYQGALFAIQWLATEQVTVGQKVPVTIYMDSELVVRQLNGIYKIKNIELKKLNKKIQDLISDNDLEIVFNHIVRSKNKIADFLVNKELDENV